MIEIEGVTKVYGGKSTGFTALDDVSVTIEDNEFFTLLGPSGCGKTTLLRVIAGFIAPTRGKVALDGEDLVSLPPYKRPVNTVFQSYALFPHMTVAENIGFGLKMLNRPVAEVRKVVDEMLGLVRMSDMANRRTSEISGGQQQRVALARALAPRPKVLLLDEPLSALDYKLRKEMQIELKRLQAETGITFVFVTHDQEEALTMSDRIGVMSKGRILQIGTPRDIYAHPSSRFVADFIGETNFLDARIAGGIAQFGGVGIPVETRHADGAATLAVRPEHVRIVPEGTLGALQATVANAVYFGTDSHLHLRLGDGTEIVARQQTDPAGAAGPERGAGVGVTFAPGAIQVLDD